MKERVVLVRLLLLLSVVGEVGWEDIGVGLGEGLLSVVETWFFLGSVEGDGGFVEEVEDEVEACWVELDIETETSEESEGE